MKFYDWKIKVLENEKSEIEKDSKMDLKQQRKELSERSDAIKNLQEQKKTWKDNHKTKQNQKMFSNPSKNVCMSLASLRRVESVDPMNTKVIIPRGFVTLPYTPGMTLKTYESKKQEFLDELQQAAEPLLLSLQNLKAQETNA